MSIKDYNKSITIMDATTGDIIDTIVLNHYSYTTIVCIINDIFLDDFNGNQHGILIKFGIKP